MAELLSSCFLAVEYYSFGGIKLVIIERTEIMSSYKWKQEIKKEEGDMRMGKRKEKNYGYLPRIIPYEIYEICSLNITIKIEK